MVRFNLIRHGQTQWNLEHRIQGEKNLPLSAQGRLQVKSWGSCLKKMSLDLILSSPMIRARETSEILGKGLGLEIFEEKNLREQSFGLWEGRRINDIRQACPGAVEYQESLGWDFCPPGGESRNGVLKRSLGAFEQAAKRFKGHNVLVVVHNGVMRSLVYHALGRAFLPGEKQVIKNWHLHGFSWDQGLVLERLNLMNLSCCHKQNCSKGV